MPDLSYMLLPQLLNHRLPDLELGDGNITPDYSGFSILNIPNLLCQVFEIPPIVSGKAPAILLGPSLFNSQHVILILIDALSFTRLQRWIEGGFFPLWADLAKEGTFAPLTSSVPSTTSTALTSLWTGHSTREHAIAGYELWLKEYGMVVNSILQIPMSFQDKPGSLIKAGFTPQEFMRLPTFGTHLVQNNIQPFAFQHHSIARSGLSQMLLRDVNIQPFSSVADLWVNARLTLEHNYHKRNLLWVYWGELDNFSHNYGPEDERTLADLVLFYSAYEQLFSDRLPEHVRNETSVILIADHGQISTQPDPHFNLRNHLPLVHQLHMLPTGENRLAYFYIRPGHLESTKEYIQQTWGDQFTFLDPSKAVEMGLFGTGNQNQQLMDRIGDLLVIAKGNAYLWWSNKEDHLFGRHGGFSPDEMLVPYLAARLT